MFFIKMIKPYIKKKKKRIRDEKGQYGIYIINQNRKVEIWYVYVIP